MARVVGIDLGTTYSAIATLDERGQPITLPNSDGEMLTPSAVFLKGNRAVIGQPAIDVQHEQPANVATLIKRRMGHSEYGEVDGQLLRPEPLSALILRKLVQDAEKRLGKIEGVVITVPAYFDDTRRKATQDAGRIAGLNVIDILDEPTAAALAYSFQHLNNAKSQTVLVYDLGGGTFDVSIVRLSPKRFQVLAIEGDVRLGGKDFDDRLVNYVADLFQRKYHDDPRDDPQSLVMLQAAAERAKRTLSKLDEAGITISHAGEKLSVPISRAEFELRTKDLLVRTRLTTQQVLKQASLSWDKVDRILLVGGSTHMPMTSLMLEELTGRKPDNSLAVSEVVARGAALHAGIKMARSSNADESLSSEVISDLEDVVEVSVNSHSLGIQVRAKRGNETEKINDILIPKNSQLPASASRIYRTAKEGQNKVRVRVLQGEAHQAEACISIGECWITGLSRNLPKNSPIQVRCTLQPNGIVEVAALDMTKGKVAQATLHRTSGLSEEEIAVQSDWVRGVQVS
ncbi:Hsp70 family protein [Telmatocola sphagniphila]|uniref:Hsp70 family protein n=1 Tax=Telmatocola sphagniphila TaxID=1123043 RepID=A0A8E6B5T2_9BACT|nr:Hsp70 family protein [Telmatocola sphagniphila]QVL31994.1 Hsp70 family protein [Telmatocola sphagniphila]